MQIYKQRRFVIVCLMICLFTVVYCFLVGVEFSSTSIELPLVQNDENSRDLLNRIRNYLDVSFAPSCKVKHISNSYFDEHALGDKFEGSCHQSHIVWDKQAQTFVVNCSSIDEIPMYRVDPYKWKRRVSQEEWRIFPSEEMRSKYPDLASEQYPVSSAGMSLIHTACVNMRNKNSVHNFRIQVLRDGFIVGKRKSLVTKVQKHSLSDQLPVNIRVIITDSVSQDAFNLKFPHTKSYIATLKQLAQSMNFTILEMKDYHIIGQNTIPNMLGFVTGRSINDTHNFQHWNSNLDKYPPILWNDLMKLGYITSVGEDVGIHSEIQLLYGGSETRPTFDVPPLFHQIARMTNARIRGTRFNYSPHVCPCAGDRFMAQHVFDFAESMTQAFEDVPLFTMTVNHEAHDRTGNQILGLDRYLKDHIQWYVDTNRTSNTVIVITSDHGAHYGDHFKINRRRAIRTHENPYMIFLVPNHLATNTFRKNVDKLVTLKDLHMTLRDLASFPVRSTGNLTRIDALSMVYDEIPAHRTCSDVKVPKSYALFCQRN